MRSQTAPLDLTLSDFEFKKNQGPAFDGLYFIK